MICRLLPLLLLPAMVAESAAMESGGFHDTFDNYNPEIWGETIGKAALVQTGVWMRNIEVRDGRLIIAPTAGQEFVSSNLEFEASDLSFEAEIGNIGTSGAAVFCYLGFRGTHDSCYFMVQEGGVVAVLVKGGKGRAAHTCGSVQAGKTHKFEIKRRPDRIEMMMDGAKVWETAEALDIPNDPMPVWFGANVVVNPDSSGRTSDAATGIKLASLAIDNVLVRDVVGDSQPADTAASATGELVEVETDSGALTLLSGAGVAWSGLSHKKTGSQLMAAAGQGSPVFIVDIGDHRYPSNTFDVEAADRTQTGGALIRLAHKQAGLRAVLTAEPDRQTGAFFLGLEVTNTARQTREIQSTFPVVGPLLLGGGADDIEYFYPWRTGITGKVNCKLTNEYGAGCWIQAMAIWNAKTGNALHCFPEDPSGRVKGMHFTKLGAKEPLIRHGEPIYSFIARPPFKFRQGAGFTYYHVPRSLAPGETQPYPATRLVIHGGNWREALADYRNWARTWFRKVKTPQWFERSFTFNPAHPADFWSAEKNRYVQSETIDPSSDVVQWYKWEQHEDRSATPGLSQMQETQPGDFDYHSGRGGLAAFRREIRNLQAKGTRFTVYINHRFCWKESRTGRAHGDDWAAMYAPGSYGYYAHPDDRWLMPFYGTGRWVEHLAGVCGRLVRDTGMDGVYLDELNFAFQDHHPGRAAEYGPDAPVPVPLLAQAVTKIRNAMQRENTNAVLYVEHAGSDYMAQFVDGSWMQTFFDSAFPFAGKHFDDDSLVYFRFVFPEFKLAQWGDSAGGPQRCFFNGIGSPYFQLADLHTILHENADAFTGLQPEPLVATTRARLLANRFPAGDKAVFTLYNKTGAPVDEPALRVERRVGRHYVDLRRGLPLASEDNESERLVRVSLAAGQVTAIADLPRLLSCERTPEGLAFRIAGDPAGLRLTYGSSPATDAGSIESAAPQGVLPLPVGPAHVKLTTNGILVDWWIGL